LAFIRERRAAAIVNQPMTASNTNLPGMGNMRQPIFGKTKAFLKESSTGDIYEINWSPAIIGRPDANNPASANALAVNLATHMEGRTVSRRHAQVTEYGGHFFAESLNPDNPTLVNDAAVQIGEKRLMQSGDRIQVGKITLEFGLKLG
jgi:pSer/pThr/pTyr-binding forkhead associated (FHA) protein